MSRGNEPAYPVPMPDDLRDVRAIAGYGAAGMTIREAYVMAAMQGLCADPVCELTADDLAIAAITVADATLRALEQSDGT